ncbi:MAG: type IV pilus assembly protein PilM [Deltaproteobacteria bacterium]|nr:type IV pilus assembly protein PilM [Deltaproteobacteria bacterium]
MLDLREIISGKKKLVGLDIGSSSLKLAEVISNSKGHYLNRFVEIPLPKGVIIDGVLADTNTLSLKIKEIFRNARCGRKGTVTSITGNSVIIKKVTLEQMNEAELRDLIHDEAGKYLPFENMDDVNYDFQILGENNYNPNQMDVIVVAAKKEIVNSYLEAFTAAGQNVEIMDVAPFVLETLYETNYEFDNEEIVIIINIGASTTGINVVKGGTSIFTRDFALAGNSITESLQEKYKVTFEEAEKIKIEGLPNASERENLDLKNSIFELAQPICLEIERSIDYFRSTFGGEDIKQILLAGGSAKINNLAKYLSETLNVKTELINPFLKINYNKRNIDVKNLESIKPVAATAIGLGLRKIGDK